MSTPIDDAPQHRMPPVLSRGAPSGGLLANRYRIESVLGHGGMGVVYRAFDQQTGQNVAIKSFFPPAGAEEGTRRFQREFRALTRLQHPRIVRVFDYGEEGGMPFYVMEFIAGQDLTGLRHARGGRLPVRETIAVGMQVCEALAYIHAQGVIHRDLKPSNVMVEDGDGLPISDVNLSIKLVDFGLAKFTESTVNLTQSGIMLGTINYISPEQGQALPIDPRADLYSLGVMLFELATGQLPYIADTPVAVLLQHITQTPPSLRSLEPSIPPEFETLVLALLAKRPADRPPSAEAVLNRLASLTSLVAPTPIEITAPPRADAVFFAGLIGRQAEMARLNQCLEQAWAGEGQLVLIEGEAGVGKTRLATELGGQVRLRGGLRLVGACHESEHVPYGAFAEWLDDVLNAEGSDSLIAGYEADLAVLVPRLARAGAEPPARLDPDQARLRLFDAVLQVLTRLSERKPLMLLIDDLQWADQATLELLHYLVRNARGRRMLICVTVRREEREALAMLLRDLSRLRLLERIELERLSPQATSELIAALLGLEEAPPELAERIYLESEGNPFFVEEVLKALAEEGLLVRREGRWHLQADASLTMLRIPATVVDVIERRLARLNPSGRNVINWAAVVGYEFAYDILPLASGVQEDELLDALDSLLRDQLIVEVRDPRQDKYRFTHAKIREVVYAGLSGARRKKMHRSTGETIEKLYAARLEEISPVLAHHFSEGGDTPRALRYNIQAGDRARKVYANQEAIAFYRRALELVADATRFEGGAYGDYLIAAQRGLAQVYYLIGEYEQAAASFRAMIDLAAQSEQSETERRRLLAEAWRGVGNTQEKLGNYPAALNCYEQGLAGLDESDAEERAMLLNDIALVYIHHGRYAQAQTLCEQVIGMGLSRQDIVAVAYGHLGLAAGLQGDYAAAVAWHLKSLSLWEQVGDKAQVAKALNNLGMISEESGSCDQAVEYYQKSLVLCREIGHNVGIAALLNNLGVIYQNRQQLDLARDHFEQSLEIYRRIGSKEGVAIAYVNLAEILLAQGETATAMDHIRQAEAAIKDEGDKSTLAYIWILMAEAELAERQLERARDCAWRVLQLANESGMRLEAGKAHFLLGQVYLQNGQPDQAGEHLAQARDIFEAMGKQRELEQVRDLQVSQCL